MRPNFADARPLAPPRLKFQRYFRDASRTEQKQNFPLDERNGMRTYSDHNPKRERSGEHEVKPSIDAAKAPREKDATEMTGFIVSFALPFLFCASAVLALAALGLTWRTYGRELQVLRAQLAATPDLREFSTRVATVQVREFSSAKRRTAIRVRAKDLARVQRMGSRRATA